MYFFDSNLNGQITPPNSQHLISCRINIGDIIKISNFQGTVLEVKISKFEKSQNIFEYEILNQRTFPKPTPKILFQAMISKVYLEKLFEVLPIIGITKIYLFESQFSPKHNLSLSRLQAILTRSLEQSENPFYPENIYLKKSEIKGLLTTHKPVLLNQINQKTELKISNSNSVLVGPEGGFSDQELTEFTQLGLTQISLGDKVFPAWLAGYTYFSTIL